MNYCVCTLYSKVRVSRGAFIKSSHSHTSLRKLGSFASGTRWTPSIFFDDCHCSYSQLSILQLAVLVCYGGGVV